jgi:hypothetical protein
MNDVWAIDLLPVVRKQANGKAGAPNTWSEEQLRALVYLRDVRRKEWGEIARALKRPLSSCHRKYEAIVRDRQPVQANALSADAPKRRIRFHEELGIQTYRVCSTVVDASGRITVKQITLSAGISS